VSFGLDRRHVVERLVDSLAIEPVDVVQCRPFDVLDAAPGSLAIDQFGLVEAGERISERNRNCHSWSQPTPRSGATRLTRG